MTGIQAAPDLFPEADRSPATIARIRQAILDALADDGRRLERTMVAVEAGWDADLRERWAIVRGVSPPVIAIYSHAADEVVRLERPEPAAWPRS